MTPFLRLDAVALPIAQANLDTDQIIPARYLQKARADDFGRYLFHGLRYLDDGSENPRFLLNQAAYRHARIVVGGPNFACGSSREHAVWALYDYGIRAVIAPSFGDIFYANALKNGLLPIVVPPDVHAALLSAPGAVVRVDLASQTLTLPDQTAVRFPIDEFPKHCLLEGVDELEYILRHEAAIAAYESRQAGGVRKDCAGVPVG